MDMFNQRKVDGAVKGRRQRSDKMKQHGRRYQKNAGTPQDIGIAIGSGPGAEKYGHGFMLNGDAVSQRDGRDMFRGSKSVRRGSPGGTGMCPPTCPYRAKNKGNPHGCTCSHKVKAEARMYVGSAARKACRKGTDE